MTDGNETIEYSVVRLEFDGPLAILTLNDPASLNALSVVMAEEVVQAINELSKPRRHCRGLLVTATGRGFCAGVNLMATRKSIEAGNHQLRTIGNIETIFHPMLRRLHALQIPVIAGVNGLALGIGLGLVLAADYVIASDTAYFQAPFKKLASAPDSGLSWLLPRIVGTMRAKRMLMRAEKVDARTALDWGMAAEVVDTADLPGRAHAVAMEFAQDATLALGEIKTLIRQGLRGDLDSSFEQEAAAVQRTARTKDNLAAVKVFASKARPVFTGT